MTDHDRARLEEAEVAAQRIARMIAAQTPRGWRFLLWLSSAGDSGYSTYVANVQRESAIAMIEEWLLRVRERPDTVFEDNTGEPDRCWCCGATKDLVTRAGRVRQVVLCKTCLGTH